jgi:hypothetical protein
MMSRCKNCGQQTRRRSNLARDRRTSACTLCGGWSFDAPVETPAEELYSEPYFNGTEYANYLASSSVHRKNFERKLSILRSRSMLPRQGLRVLEIGCATGEFGVLVMTICDSNPAPQYLGLEISQYGRDLARTRGLRVFSPRGPEADHAIRALRPNLIVAWDVWEHLPDPTATLDDLLRCADPDAIIALTTVDTSSWIPRVRKHRWRQYHPPTHLNYPTRKSLEIYFTHKQRAILYHRSFGYTRSLADYVRPFSTMLFHRRPPWPWLYKVPLYLNLFDIQMVVAGRKA